MSFSWTDTMTSGLLVKDTHYTELKTNISTVRSMRGLSTYWIGSASDDVPIYLNLIEELKYGIDKAKDEDYCHAYYSSHNSSYCSAYYDTHYGSWYSCVGKA